MSLFHALTNKPWLDSDSVPETEALPVEKVRRTGVRFLLIVISMLFFLFLVAFLMRSQYTDWQPLAEEPNHPLYNQSALWLNTFFLVLASLAIQAGRMWANKAQFRLAVFGLMLAGAFSVAFVIGQLSFWQQLTHQGFLVNSNPALSFFYLFTGLHAAHVAIGVLVWLYALLTTLRGSTRYAEMINLCAMYWHFLLGLWGLLFAVLVSKPETYDAIAAFCGLG